MKEQHLSVRDVIVQRRSIKVFNGQPVTREEVLSILSDAMWAPNHKYREPWRFIVATGDELKKLQEVIREISMPKWKDLTGEALEKQMKKITGPGAVVFVVVPDDVRQNVRLEDYAAGSALIQNAMLLAWDLSIGTCWKTPTYMEDPKFREKLKVNLGERVISMLQFGYFDVEPIVRPRKSIEEVVTYFGE